MKHMQRINTVHVSFKKAEVAMLSATVRLLYSRGASPSINRLHRHLACLDCIARPLVGIDHAQGGQPMWIISSVRHVHATCRSTSLPTVASCAANHVVTMYWL